MPHQKPHQVDSLIGIENGTAHESPNGSKPFRVLLVDHEAQVRDVMRQAMSDRIIKNEVDLSVVDSIEQAKAHLVEHATDLVLIEPNMPAHEGQPDGMSYARELTRTRPQTQTILITDEPNLKRAIEAIRVGVSDLIVKPLDLNELNERVREAIARHADHNRHRRRVKRLKKICQKLNTSRQEISQQVDTLCNDLVTAYQELANQMQHVVQTQEFVLRIKDELDLEQLLRTTLEYLLEKVGPTNAAIFLPSEADQDYTLGGYVNYSFSDDVADMLLQHLADVLSPRIAESPEPVLINDNNTLTEWVGDDFAYLEDSHILSFPCVCDDETLAVVVLFRDQREPLNDADVELASAMMSLVGEHLKRIIRVHHRQLMHDDIPSTFSFGDAQMESDDPSSWGKSWHPDDDNSQEDDEDGMAM